MHKKSIFLFVLVLLMLGSFFGCANNDKDNNLETIQFIIDGSTITGLSEDAYKSEEIEIPSNISGVEITSIGKGAFKDCDRIKKITLPETIKNIGDSAFYGCSGLTTINLPRGIESIGEEAFYNCNQLTSINLPAGIDKIAAKTFKECRGLKEIVFPSNILIIESESFYKCNGLVEINIPSTIKNIAIDAFSCCKNIEKFIVDANNINYSSFDGNLYDKNRSKLIWYSLGKKSSSYTIPEGVISIGQHAFAYETDLVNIKIANSVESIGYGAFTGCGALETVSFGGENSNLKKIDHRAFFNNVLLKTIEVPPKLEYVGKYAFTNCTSISQVISYVSKTGWENINIERTDSGNATFIKESVRIYK